MWVSEKLLFLLARSLYRTEIVHTKEMKEAVSTIDNCDLYRSEKIHSIIDVLNKYGIDIRQKTVADFGCNDGAISRTYINEGARQVVGIDIDRKAIERANDLHASANVSFCLSSTDRIPLEDETTDVIVSSCVFEHVSKPAKILDECYRILKPRGKMLIGTWGWHHPFAPHLFATMPVPWAHVFFSERTILRVCRKVYNSPWYVPTMHDLDESGKKLPNRYLEEHISREYVNKLLIRDFEKVFRKCNFQYEMHLLPFGSRYANWTKIFLKVPILREFVTGYFWAVLTRQ